MASAAIVVQREDASWLQTHEELVRLATERAGLDFEEGRWLLQAHRSAVHLRFGYAAFYEYIEHLFGYGPRLTQEKLRVAAALEELPETAEKLRTGGISFSHARELTRVSTPSTEKEWLEVARGKTVRQVEQLVSGHRPGSLPEDVPDAELERHVVRLELSGNAFATFREAMGRMRRDAGESLDDDSAILLLCRQAIEGTRDAGRASYQIALTVCESCRRAKQQGHGELIEVSPEVLEMAECDAQHIGQVDAHVGADVDDDESARDHVRAGHACGSGLGSAVHAIPARASQTIPPATRRAVLRRDGEKCRVPGCRHAAYKEPHHIVLRSEGGTNHRDNLVTLCVAHHLAVHEGRLLVAGLASSELRFSHADGTPYGGAVAPAVADARARAFQALRGLRFREGDAKRALAKIPYSVCSLEELVRQALRDLVSQQHHAPGA
jgi:hypothetical protein